MSPASLCSLCTYQDWLPACLCRLEDTRRKQKEDRKKAVAAQPKQKRDLAVSASTMLLLGQLRCRQQVPTR